MNNENIPDANEIIAETASDSTSEPIDSASQPEDIQFSASLPEAKLLPSNKKDSPLIWIKGKLVEESLPIVLVPRKKLKSLSRRQFIFFGAGIAAVTAGYRWLLPDGSEPMQGLSQNKENFLKSINNFDDAVAKSLYSKNHLVPTYSKSQLTDLPNNYAGQTPGPEYLNDWKLRISGLAAGHDMILTADQLRNDFSHNEIISRMVCVEGWSAIAWWGGLKFADLLTKYPPRADTRWIKLTSDVNLNSKGNSDPYFVSMDLASALHPQTLLVTHHNGKELEVEHGAPLRLLAPMKLGLKNIKAITSIEYSKDEPDDYWNNDGYSYYDGI